MKRGSLFDALFVGVGFFAFALTLIIGYYVFSQFRTTGADVFSANATAAGESVTESLKLFDGIAVFIIIGSSVATIVSALFIDSHPIFFVVGFLLQLILIGMSTIFSNIYYRIGQVAILQSTANEFPLIMAVFENLPLITLIVSAFVIIVMHGKSGGTGYAEY